MKQTNIELKLLVENIGFKYDKRLSSWLQNILQEKENFARQFVITRRDKNNVSKAKIMEVNTDAKVLVENLCFIYSFKSFFPRAEENRNRDYPPYKDLKSGSYKDYFEVKAAKLKKDLKTEGERNINAQTALEDFFCVLSSVDKLDITKESIRKLISNQPHNTISAPFSPQELGAWNELVTLKNKLEERPNDMALLRQLAEKHVLLNESDRAIDILQDAVSHNSSDGNAWAILTKIYFDKFIENQKEHAESNARSEYMGEIPHPINSEERWINARIEDSYDQVITIRDKFINAAFNALQHWPKSESTSKSRDFYYDYYSGGNDIKLIRGWIFFHLTIVLKQNDFNGERKKEFLETLESFPEHFYKYKSFPDLELSMFSAEYHQELSFQIKITSLLKFLSKQKYEQSLDDFILMFDDDLLQDQPERYLTSVEKNLAVLSNSLISQDFWEYLGANKYKNIYDRLYQKSIQTKEVVRLNVFGKKVKDNIYSVLQPFVNHYHRSIIGLPLYEEKELPVEEIAEHFSTCAKKTEGDLNFITKLNSETSYPIKPKELYASLWWLLILDYMVNKTTTSEKALSRFTPEEVYSFLEEDIAHGFHVGRSGCYNLDFIYLLKRNLKIHTPPQFIIEQILYIREKIEEITNEYFQLYG